MRETSWRPDGLVEILTSLISAKKFNFRSSVYIGLLLFALYWIIPALLCWRDGSLVAPGDLERMTNWIRRLDRTNQWGSMAVPSDQLATPRNVLFYLHDATHFLFSVVLAALAFLGNLLFDRVESIREDLRRAGARISAFDDAAITEAFWRYRTKFRGRRWYKWSLHQILVRCFAAVAGVTAFLFFYSLRQTQCVAEACWWGQFEQGYAGVYYSFAIGFLVFFAAEGLAALVAGASMINFILQHRLSKPNLFAEDLANGMSPVGDFILIGFLCSFMGALGVYVVLGMGYFGVEHLTPIWVALIFGTIFIPVSTLVPMYSAIQSISEAKQVALKHVNSMLDAQLLVDQEGHLQPKPDVSRNLGPAIELYRHIADLNAFPFDKNKAVISAITFFFVIGQSFYNLFSLYRSITS